MRAKLSGIRGWQWLIVTALVLLPGTLLLLPLLSWFLGRRRLATAEA